MLQMVYLDYFLASFPIPLTEAHVYYKKGERLEMQLFESNLHKNRPSFITLLERNVRNFIRRWMIVETLSFIRFF